MKGRTRGWCIMGSSLVTVKACHIERAEACVKYVTAQMSIRLCGVEVRRGRVPAQVSFLTMVRNLEGLSSNPGEDMDVCKCIVPLRHGGTLNSRRAVSPLVWLGEGEER
ncbi:hypothetical protein TNCV_1123031 [Trichonephila clavipes]|uniref:Uncharacterized protein n=1 Tax=Trichonephila clavipes TaxID=2585209 RepID=A0A8X6SG38_TRICX|nr:hypothetical protein TNCV_1123031 [Trichonephila clavipes]